MSGPETTITLTHDVPGVEPPRCAALFVVLDPGQPRRSGSRHLLRDVDRVVLGRGPERTAERGRRDGQRTLRITLPDPRVSTDHAALERVLGSWHIVDLGSKNGIVIAGARVARHQLADGDWIELGRTLLRFRDGLAVAPGAALDRDGRDLDSALGSLVPAVEQVASTLTEIAPTAVAVLLDGETGTGKEVAARILHARSGRSGGFVAVNCSALPEGLVASSLFGHRRGAFSGAVDDRPGLVRAADRGTLFLDEIGDLPLASQGALLRVLQEREVVPVGDASAIPVDVRVVAATLRDLDADVAAGRFRIDLLARLTGLRLTLPPLRERMEDLGVLLADLLARHAPGRTVELTRPAAAALWQHRWPRNVRELEQALVAGLAQAGGEAIDLPHLPDALRPGAAPAPIAIGTGGDPRAQLAALLREHQGNLAAVARALGTSRTQVHRLLRRYALDRSPNR